MKSVLFVLFSVLALKSQAQAYTYYKNDKGIYTEHQVDSMVKIFQAKLLAKGHKDLKVMKEVTSEHRNGDTLFYAFQISATSTKIDNDINAGRAKFIGKALPAFTLKDINGNTVHSADLVGKPTVINFWFIACKPCVSEMPDLNKMKTLHQDVQFLAMTFDNKEKVAQFLKEKQFDFLQIADAGTYVRSMASSYPTTMFIDAKGIVREITTGATLQGLNIEEFNRAIAKIK
jgi:peroxiredoxin